MTTDKNIFGLRFKSNDALLPSQEELKAFLDSPKQQGSPGLHGDDLARYLKLLSDVRAYELRRQDGASQVNFGERIFYGVLAHSHFVSPALQSVVEQYKFQLHALAALDFKKPTAFIKSAEQEMGRLNPKKKEEAARLQRFQMMIDERMQALEGLARRWTSLVEELGHIVRYIRENLSRIEKLCETSIVVLVSEQIDRKKELDLIENVKAQIKERLRESLRQGTITREQLDSAKEEVAALSKQTADFIRSDVYALTRLYEAIHEHAERIVRELDELVAQIAAKRTDFEEDKRLFAGLERVLVSLVTDFRLKMQSAEIRKETEHDAVLFENRKEVLDHLFDLLQN
jgi:methyl-accepting chemotaxis protein